MLELKEICKIYEADSVETKALSNVSLTIEKQEFVAIMGTSGSGKTTLLNILGGMDRATSGEYIFEETPVHTLSQHQLTLFRKKNIGFVFQNFALMNNYTVFENVEMPLLMRKMSAKDRKEKVKAALEKMNISELANKRPSHLSGGQQQRCAIARAMVTENKLILADEPTGALDSATSAHIMDALKLLNRAGKTVIVVTHDIKVAQCADRTIEILDGKIVQSIN